MTIKTKYKIVLFGASTIAFREKLKVASIQLQEYMDAKSYNVEVINSGVRGNNTNLALARFDKDVLNHDPDMVFIMLGINDAAIDLIDIFKIFQDKYKTDDELRKVLPDGMHPGEEGQTLIFNAIRELLERRFKLK